jgi:uncharacterized protein DUF4224
VKVILGADELFLLTGYERRAEQRRVLDEAGIPWKELAGRTIVLTAHVEAWMTGKAIQRTAAPRMDLVR